MRFIFTTSDSLASKAIRAAEGGEPSHVGIVTPDGDVIDSTFRYGGVKVWGKDHWLSLDDRRVVSDITFNTPNDAAGYDWLYRQLHKPYDTLGLLGMAFWRDMGEEDKWWCSEIALFTALNAGRSLAGRNRRMGVRPLMEISYAWAGQG